MAENDAGPYSTPAKDSLSLNRGTPRVVRPASMNGMHGRYPLAHRSVLWLYAVAYTMSLSSVCQDTRHTAAPIIRPAA